MPEQCLFAGDGSCDELRGAKEVTVFTSEFYNVLTTVRNCSKSTGLKMLKIMHYDICDINEKLSDFYYKRGIK